VKSSCLLQLTFHGCLPPRTQNWLVALFVLKITSLHAPHGKHHLPLLWIYVYSCVPWQQTSHSSVLLLGADCTENSFPSVFVCINVYKAVAWQCVDQIRYTVLYFDVVFWHCLCHMHAVFYCRYTAISAVHKLYSSNIWVMSQLHVSTLLHCHRTLKVHLFHKLLLL
jgi:hypothetical protein